MIEADLDKWLMTVKGWYDNSQSISDMVEQQQQSPSLAAFLESLQQLMCSMDSVEVIVVKLPRVGQLLGRICALPSLLKHAGLYHSLLQCLLCFYTDHPTNALQHKAAKWAMTQIRSTIQSDVCTKPGQEISASQEEYEEERLIKFEQSISELTVVPRRQFDVGLQSWILPAAHEASDVFMGLCKLCYAMREKPRISDLLDLLLEHLHTCHSSSKLTTFWQDLAALHENPYTRSVAISPKLGFRAQLALWMSCLPSLEHEVLDLLAATAPPHIDKQKFLEITQRSHLIKACAESSCIMETVENIFASIAQSIEKAARLSCIIGWFYECVTASIKQDCLPKSFSYPKGLVSLFSQMEVVPNSLDHASFHIQVLDDLVRETAVSVSPELLQVHLCKRFYRWYFITLILIFTMNKKVLCSALRLLLAYHSLSDSKAAFEVLKEITENLLLLRSKRTVCTEDISCAIPSEVLSHPDYGQLCKHLTSIYAITSPIDLDTSQLILNHLLPNASHLTRLSTLLPVVRNVRNFMTEDIIDKALPELSNIANCFYKLAFQKVATNSQDMEKLHSLQLEYRFVGAS